MGNSGKLTDLQVLVLQHLAGIEPPWTLVGGAALAGVHLAHRQTRDLDLFWRGMQALEELTKIAIGRIEAARLQVKTLQSGPTFARLRVADEREVVIVELVCEPSAALVADETVTVGDQVIRVASRHDILVDKLCALLGRSELRDLIDVQALIEAGADLGRAIHDAPRKDAGFSPLTLAWVLESLDPESLAAAADLDDDETEGLVRFRDELITILVNSARPAE